MAIVDLVSWSPQDEITIYAYRFPETNLSTYTQLIVQESQEAILFSKGQLAGKFGPGKHTLSTENLPIIRGLFGLPFGGKNPFTAEVWFVNKVQPYNIDWEIEKMDIHDADYNTGIPLVGKGRYGLRIMDAERFLIKIVGAKSKFDQNDLTDHFFGEFSTKTKSTILQFMINNRIGLKQINAYLDKISDHLRDIMLPFWENFGFELTKFYVTSIEVDTRNELGRRVMDAISRQSAQSIGGYTWQQSQAFEVAKDAVTGIGGGDSLLGALLATNMINSGNATSFMQPQYEQPSFSPTQAGASSGVSGSGSARPAIREVFCSNCSKKFPSSNRFCPHCGDEYTACPKCGTDNDKNARRCVSCGVNLGEAISVCIYCNAPISSNSTFCGVCGKSNQVADTCNRCNNPLSPANKFCPKCGLKR
jgi:membrane protease subunit (stomatin/prohibitin family)